MNEITVMRRAVRLVAMAIASLSLVHCAARAASTTVTVTANPLWSDTQISMVAGDTVAIRDATGIWNWGGSWVGPEGYPGASEADTWITSSPFASLIGFVGPDPYQAGQDDPGFFGVGNRNVVLSGRTGKLWLGFNDDALSHNVSDNDGSVSVAIFLNPPDITPTALDWDTQQTQIHFKYRIDNTDLPRDATLALYWARGEKLTDRIDGQPIPGTRRTLQRAKGDSPDFYVPYASLGQPPDGATHILLFVDDQGQIDESDESNNVKALSLGLPDIEAVKLELSLGYANAVITYRIREKVIPTDTQFGLYWARGPNSGDIITLAMPLETLPNVGVGTWQIHRSALTPSQLLTPPPDATYVLLVVDPPLPRGAVLESSEDNNVYPFPIVPIAPTFEIVFGPLNSEPSTTSRGDPLWKNRPYNVWLRVKNNWTRDISVNGTWAETLPAQPRVNGPAKSGTFDLVAIAGGEIKYLPLGPGSSGAEFLHTWDWIPPREPAVPAALPTAVKQFSVEASNELFKMALKRLLKLETEVPYVSGGYKLYEAILDSFEEENALKDEVTQAIAKISTRLVWWPTIDGQQLAKTAESSSELPILVRNEQRDAHRHFWPLHWMSKLHADNATVPTPNFLWELYLSIYYQRAASAEYALAVDPPDANFSQIVIPLTNRPPDLATMPDGSMKQLAFAAIDIGAFTDAKVTALNRAQGAESAGAFDWQARQLVEAATFFRASALLHAWALLLTKEVGPEMQLTIAANKHLLVPTLQRSGLPPSIATNLIQLGWTPAEIEDYRQNLIELGTSLLDEPGLSEMSLVLGACLASTEAAQQLFAAISIRRDKMDVVPSAITTAQRQQLAAAQLQIEERLATMDPDSNVLSQVSAYLSALHGIAEQTSNPEDMSEEFAFGDAALGTILSRVSGVENYTRLAIQSTTNGVVLTWPALSSFALETSENLGAPSWTVVATTPTNRFGQAELSLTPASSTAFFRLRKTEPIRSISAAFGGTNVDGTFLVRDPHLTGIITDGMGVSQLVGGFVTSAGVAFTDLSAGLSPYFRRFALDRTQLEQIFGEPLLDGNHTLRLRALDAQGNVISSSDFNFRLDTRPPTVHLTTSVVDVDTNRAGIQVYEGARIPVRTGVFDEVQVKSLELLSNGMVVATGSVFPWEDFIVKAPAFAPGSNIITLQARGTDSAGNVGLSTPLVIEVVEDAIPPFVTSIFPPDGAILTLDSNNTQVVMTFSEPLDPATVNLTNILLFEAGPGGVFGDGNDLLVTNTSLVFGLDTPFAELDFPALGLGSYEIRILGSNVTDLAGNTFTNQFVSRFRVMGRTTIIGRVQRTNGAPVSGATVTVAPQGRTGVTGSDGRFSIAGVPTWLPIDGLSIQTRTNAALFGFARNLSVVDEGITDAGVIIVRTLCETVPGNCLDSDGDGIPDAVEFLLGLNSANRDSNFNGVPDGAEDYDGDGISNFAEVMLGTNPKLADSDGDGLTDYEELFIYHTDPNNPDTDGDGWPDGLEIRYGTNPLDPNSKPVLRISTVSFPVTVFNIAPESGPTNLFLFSPIVTYENR